MTDELRILLDGEEREGAAGETQDVITRGLIVAEAVMMALAPLVGRQPAHDLVYAACRRAIEADRSLFDELAGTPEIRGLLEPMRCCSSRIPLTI